MKNLLNKKLFIIAFCLTLVIPAFSASWGLPTYLYILSDSIQDYPGTNDLPRSHAHKGRFVNGVIGNIKSKYSAISTSNLDYQDSAATTTSLNNSNTYEMVFFAGHGNTSGPAMYNGTLNNSKSFGGWTRWVIWDACLTMNQSFDYMLPRFNGVHGMFGYKSIGYQFHKWTDYWIFGTGNHEYSEELWSRFANRWVKDGWGMWDAFQDGVQVEVANEGYSVQIGAFYMKGTIDGGYLDGSNEKLANVYNGPIQWAQATEGCWTRQTTWGNPAY